jgi:hypothetical protein
MCIYGPCGSCAGYLEYPFQNRTSIVLSLYLFFGIYSKGGDNKVSCLLNSSIEFPTLLSIEVTQKRKETLTVPNFIFSEGRKFYNF